ncbi:MAG: uroporphyrinogen-III C-methyltransferase [Selenomonadaceae bacterium]|nr:uroporphyrinogen-III C-methyltransferase [Selenomonadaceae bacterium]MDY2684977.1 uroporphyrinogen-III C-methyltransferase [Selenomonadaceae bacterium]
MEQQKRPGMVYLVGAGPGDPGLLTVKAKRCLQKADVVVYDYLASPRILRWAKDTAERVYVGKRASHHTMRQADISALLVELAKQGKTVVRLKGGDPFVFGRGGEEGVALREAGVSFEIVPGVTSAIAVPAYAGIPVTHRGVAVSFAVVTGHEDPTKPESGLHWKQLATGVDTLVFLMGVTNLPKITAKLMENGRPADTPAAVIRWGTRPEQRTLVTTVGTAAEDVARAGLQPPAIFLVGEVVRLREKLQWFDRLAQRPLYGRRVLVTRSRAQASKLTAMLEQLGAEVVELPSIAIGEPDDHYASLDEAIAHLEDYAWVLFTSVNGVAHFFSRLERAGKDARALGYARVGAIGPATAEALKAHGIRADALPESYRAEGMLEALQGKLPPRAKILLPRAQEARSILPDKLREHGMQVDVVSAYATTAAPIDAKELATTLADGQIDFVTFTSSSTVRHFVTALGNITPLEKVKTACIGPITADTLRKLAKEPDIVARTYTIPGLVEALAAYVQAETLEQNDR